MIHALFGETKSKYWFVFAYVLLILLCFYPYEFRSVYWLFLPEENLYFQLGLLVATAGLLIINKSFIFDSTIGKIAFIQIVGFIFIRSFQGNLLRAISPSVTILLALCLVTLINGVSGLYDFFKKYNMWIMIMAVLGVILFFLVTFRHYQPLYWSVSADLRPIFNYGIGFSKSDLSVKDLFRYSGFFDEPGAMAYWGLYALIFNRLFYKNRKFELILTGLLLFTFSLGFYIQLLVYYLLFHVSKRNLGTAVFSVIMLFVAYNVALSTQGTEYDYIYTATIGRSEDMMDDNESSDKTGAVGNRAELTENALAKFQQHPFWGYSDKREERVSDNIYEPLARYGIFGSLFIYSPFILLLYWGIKYRQLDLIKTFLLLFVGFFHRPFHIYLLYFLVIYSLILMCKKYYIEEQES